MGVTKEQTECSFQRIDLVAEKLTVAFIHSRQSAEGIGQDQLHILI